MKLYQKALSLFIVLLFGMNLNAQSEEQTVDSSSTQTPTGVDDIWINGNSFFNAVADNRRSNTPTGLLKSGYFLSDRLMVGGTLGSGLRESTQLGIFSRFYLVDRRRKWRPFIEAGVAIELLDNRSNLLRFESALGAEKVIKDQTLLNIEFNFEGFNNIDFQRISFQAYLNTTLGGPATKTAARQFFQPGSLTLNGSLLRIEKLNAGFVEGYNFTATPSVGYLVSDNVMLTTSLAFNYAHFSLFQDLRPFDNEIRSFLRGGFRYYFTTSSLFNVYGAPNVALRYSRVPIGGLPPQTFTFWSAGLGVGNSTFINRNTSLEAAILYDYHFDNSFRESFIEVIYQIGINFWFN